MFRHEHLAAIARRIPQAIGASTFGAALFWLMLGASGPGILIGVGSTLVLLLPALHLYVRHQEAKATLHNTQLEAMVRAHEQTQRHLDDLRHIAFHDSLTGLPNRRRLQDLLHEALERASAGTGHEFNLLFLDFDRFKLINDTLGHRAGDEFLVRTSLLLLQQLRPQDVVARLGGDEFAILVEGCGCGDYAITLAERMLQVLSQPMVIHGTSVNATASIGITSSRVGYAEPGEVLRDADIAMYRAKSAGKARYSLFDVSLRQQLTKRQLLEGELRGALGRGEVHVEYQPIFDLGSRCLLGFEALLTWNHHELGRIDPRTFIPDAQECGLVVELTDFVLGQACRQLRRYQQSLPEGDALVMHVNLSGNDLGASDFVSRITGVIAAARLDPHHLVLELAESAFIERVVQALPMLHELRSLGFQLSMDDFGTGACAAHHLSMAAAEQPEGPCLRSRAYGKRRPLRELNALDFQWK